MPRSRLFMLMLAALLIAQSVLGTALHRCHDGVQPMMERNVVAMEKQGAAMPCHDNVDTNNTPITAPHGICTCAIAHCAPGLISQFDLPSKPAPTITRSLYLFVILTAPIETLLRPPIVLS